MNRTAIPDLRCSRRTMLIQAGILTCATLTDAHRRAPIAQARQPATSSTEELVAIIRAPGDPPSSAQALTEVFARSGIAVFDDTTMTPLNTPVDPVSPLSYLQSQVAAMATEIAASNERPAGDFDSLLPVESVDGNTVPPLSDLLAGYVNAGDTPGADFARAVLPPLPEDMTQIDATSLPMSTASVGLMTGEILGQLQRQLPGVGAIPTDPSLPAIPSLPGLPDLPQLPAGLNLPPLPDLDGSACSNVQRFVTTVIQRVLSVLEASETVTSIPILGAIVKGVTTVVKLAVKVIFKTAALIIEPILGVLKSIAAGIGIASALLGSLSAWSVAVRALPDRNRFGVGALDYQFGDIDIAAGGADDVAWPPIVSDCAEVAGIPLPKRTSAGAPVTLDVRQPSFKTLIQLGKEERILDEHGRLVVTYQTENETEERAKSGEEVTGIAWITATVEREDLKHLGDQVLNLLLAEVPTLVADVLRPIVGPVIDELRGRLLSIVRAHGSTMLFVTYHDDPPPTPTPASTGEAGSGFCLIGRFRVVNLDAVLATSAGGLQKTAGDMIWEFHDDQTFMMSEDGLAYTIDGAAGATVVSAVGFATGTWALDKDKVVFTWLESSIVSSSAGISIPVDVAFLNSGWPWATYGCGSPITLNLWNGLASVVQSIILEPA